MNNRKKTQSLEQGAAVLLFSTVLVKLIGAFFKIPLSSDICLGDLGFGYFSSVYDLFTPIYMLAVSGFPVAISRLVADHAASEDFGTVNKIFKSSRRLLVISGFISFVLMILLIIPFVKLTDKTGQSIYSLFAVAPSLIFCCIISCYRGYYEGLRNMIPAAVSSVIEALGKLILGFGLAFITMRITENAAFSAAMALFGISLGTMAALIYLHVKYKKDIHAVITESALKENGSDNFLITKTLILIALPIVLSSLSGSIVSLIDTVTVRWQLNLALEDNYSILVEMYSSAIEDYNSISADRLSAEALPTFLYGIRSKAFTLYNLVPTLTTALGVSAVPILADAVSRKDRDTLKKSCGSLLKISALIAFPAGIGFLSLGGRIMALLYGEGGSADIGGRMLCIFGIAAIFSGLSISVSSGLQAIGYQTASLRNALIGIAAKLISNLLLSSFVGVNIFGAVYGTLICYLVIFILNFTTLLKAVGHLPSAVGSLLKLFASACICGVAAYLISIFDSSAIVTAAAIFVAVLIYLGCIAGFKVFDQEEILNMPLGEKLLRLLNRLGFFKKQKNSTQI